MSAAGMAHLRTHPRRDVGWQENAACVGLPSEFFFPERSAVITQGARKVCDDCPVRARCLEYALTEGEWHGIWGGLSPEQRRDLARTSRETRRKAVGA